MMLFENKQFVKKCRFCSEVTDSFSALIKHEASHYIPPVIDQVDPFAAGAAEGVVVPSNVLNDQNQINGGGGGGDCQNDQCHDQDQDVKVKIERHDGQGQEESMKVDENNQLELNNYSDDDDGSSELEFDEEMQEEFKEYLDHCFSQYKSNNIRRGRGRGKGRGKGKGRPKMNKNFRIKNIKMKYTQSGTAESGMHFDFSEMDKEVIKMIHDYKWEKDAKKVVVNGEPLLECLTCSKRLKGINKISFFYHYQGAHAPNGRSLYSCHLCSQTFSQPSSRMRHISLRHSRNTDKIFQKHQPIHKRPKLSSSRRTNYVPKYDHQIQDREDEVLLSERARNYEFCKEDAKKIRTNGKLIYQCLKCSKAVSTKGVLFYHMLAHSGEFPLNCFYCPLKFRRADNRRLHEMNQHPNQMIKKESLQNSEVISDVSKYEFKQCVPEIKSSSSKSISTISRKLINKNLINPNEEQIKLYNKFREHKRGDELLLHKRIQNYNWENGGIEINIPGYKYQCKLCPQNLQTKASLFYHSQTHTMEKTLKCFFCSTYFRRIDQRHLHEMKHLHSKSSKPMKLKSKAIKKLQKYKAPTPTITSSKLKKKASTAIPKEKLAIKKEKSEPKPKPGPSNGKGAKEIESRRDDEIALFERIRTYDWKLDGKLIDTDTDIEKGKNKRLSFQCLKCDSKLSSKVSLFNHSFRHNDTLEKPLKCIICESTFIQSILRKTHEFKIHGIGTDPNSKRKSTKSDKLEIKLINSTDKIDDELNEVSNNKPIVEEPLNLSFKEPQFTANDDNSKGETDVDNNPIKLSNGTTTIREDEVLFYERLRNYNWENDGKKLEVEKDGKIVQVYECFKCQAKLKGKRAFFNHNLKHSQLKLFKCQFCSKSFRQVYSRNVHENSIHLNGRNVQKATKKSTNAKQSAKIKSPAIQSSLNDTFLAVINTTPLKEENYCEIKNDEKLSNDDDNIMESGNCILSQFSDFVLETENRKQLELELSGGVEESLGDIDMDMDYEMTSKEAENVSTNDSCDQSIELNQSTHSESDEKSNLLSASESESDEKAYGEREDEIKFTEDLTNYDWEKDAKKVKNLITCLTCNRAYRNKRDFYHHMLASHWNIQLFKCKFCEKHFGQMQSRRTHELRHSKAEKKIISKSNRFKKQKVSKDDQVNCQSPGTSPLLDESTIVNTDQMILDLSLNQEIKAKNKTKDKDKSNDYKKKKGKGKSESKNSTKVKQKYNLKNVGKCFIASSTATEDGLELKLHQCRKCFEILRGASKTELLTHVHSHSQ